MRSPLALAPTLLLVLAGPARAEESSIVSQLVAGARPIDGTGAITEEGSPLFDGNLESDGQYEPARGEGQPVVVLELPEPCDLERVEVVNALSEASYPGISTRRLRVEHAKARTGPWSVLAEDTLAKGTKPQALRTRPTKGARLLRVTLLENHGNEAWWGLGELRVFGRPSRPWPARFDGLWDTPHGLVRLEQHGDRVTGCWGSGPVGLATFEGSVEGASFSGEWFERGPDGEISTRGTLSFTRTAEGGLSGVWGTDWLRRTGRWDGAPARAGGIRCERPESSLARSLASTGRVVLRGILFDTGKDALRPESTPVLESLAAAMLAAPARRYRIEGHTDDRGAAKLNGPLSERRAGAVRSWLAAHGVKATRLEIEGLGATRPAMPNDSDAGRAANRRVEVVALD
jgi:flagellar motor protein MotB